MLSSKNKKPLIEEIIISQEKLDELKSELKRSSINKNGIIRDYCGGTCVICQEIPKFKVVYDIGQGSKLVDFYCSNCLEKHLTMMTEKIDVVSVVTNGVLGFW